MGKSGLFHCISSLLSVVDNPADWRYDEDSKSYLTKRRLFIFRILVGGVRIERIVIALLISGERR